MISKWCQSLQLLLFYYYYYHHHHYPNTLRATKALASSWTSNIHCRVLSSPWLQFCMDSLPLLLTLLAPCISSYLVWSLIVSVREHKLWILSLCTLLRPLVTSSVIDVNISHVNVQQEPGQCSPYRGSGRRFYCRQKCPVRLWCPPSLLFSG